MSAAISDRFFTRGREFLGIRYPIICGAMTWVSEPNLVAAVANAGAFACLAGGNTPLDILKQQVAQTRELTDKPFGLNLVTIAPAYKEQVAVLEQIAPEVVVFAGSFPRREEVARAKDCGCKVLCFASTASIAKRMLDYGADGLILEGMEAGGHVGHVTLAILLQQVLFAFPEVPIFTGGGIATGRMSAHMFLMGAAGVQLGTRFAMARESCAHPDFKRKFIRAKARDAVSTPQYDSRLPVVAVRALRNKGTDEFGRLQLRLIKQLDAGEISREAAQLEVELFWMGALRQAVQDGDVEGGSLMAGQSVGLIDREETAQEIVDDLVGGIEHELERVRATLV